MYATEEPNLEEMKKLQNDILKYDVENAISNKEAETMMERLQPKLNSMLVANTREQYDDNGGWAHFSIDEKDLRRFSNSVLKNAGLPTKIDKDTKLNKDDRKMYYDIQNRIYSLYNHYLDEETKKFVDNNTDKNIQFTTTYDVVKTLDFADKQTIFANALNKSKKAYAISEGVDVTNKTIDEINKSLDLKIISQNKEHIDKSIEDLIWERKKKNPFYLDIKMTPIPTDNK
jgi:hypothetical protein